MKIRFLNFETISLAIALLIALIPRILVADKYGAGISNDSYEYLSLAHNIAEHSAFNISIELHNLKDNTWIRDSTISQRKFPQVINSNYPAKPTMFRTPGYPALIGFLFKITGEDYNYLIIIQIFLQLITILLLYYGVKNLS